MAHFQTEGLEHNIVVVVALAASGPRTTSVTWGAWRAVAMSAASITVAIAVGATGAIVAITLGPTGTTTAEEVTLRYPHPAIALTVGSRGHTIVIAIGYPSPAVAVASAAWCAADVTDSAIVGKLHWAVAVILSIQPLQREYVAVSVVRFVDTASCASLLDRSLFTAVITWIHTPIARLTTLVRRLAASIRRVC
jgi:hypothetical protein